MIIRYNNPLWTVCIGDVVAHNVTTRDAAYLLADSPYSEAEIAQSVPTLGCGVGSTLMDWIAEIRTRVTAQSGHE